MPREAYLSHCPVLDSVRLHQVDPAGLDHLQKQAQIPSSRSLRGVVHW
jgi:hypothetical protein